MALELKKRSKLFLNKIAGATDLSFDDGVRLFGISNLPEFLGEGKNSFRIKPTRFKSRSRIEIEVLDRDGNPIYWETSIYKDSDNSSLVSIWVYNLPTNKRYNTPDGPATIVITATAVNDTPLRWSYPLNVVKSRQSPSDIVFKTQPNFTISSSVEIFTNKLVSNNQLITVTDEIDVFYKKSTYGNTVTLEYESLTPFNKEMVGGIVYADLSNVVLFPRLGGGQTQPTQFTASVLEVSSSNVMRIDKPITTIDTRSVGSIHTYDYSDGLVNINVEYYSTGSDTPTQNQIAFANISLSDVNPISGRIYSVRTSIKSDGLLNSDYSTIGETQIENTSSFSYKVPIPTEQLNDPKTLRLQFVNELGNVSTTEIEISSVVFTGGNVYIAGNQSLITGSFHIGNAIGTGIEMSGNSSGYLKSVGYQGITSASLGKGPGGFLIWSGSGNLQIGADQYPGVGMEMVSAGGSSSFFFTTHDGGNLKVITDEFFIGTKDTQFISGSNGNIEISSSFFHLNPKDSEAIIGGFVVTPTAISSSTIIANLGPALAFKSNGDITGSNVLIKQRVSSTNYTILDTKAGIVDARNVGRQIVSDTSEYFITSSAGIFIDVASYVFTLLPEETHLGLSFNAIALIGGASIASPTVSVTIESSSFGLVRGLGPINNYDSSFGGVTSVLTDTWAGAVASTFPSSSQSRTPQLTNAVALPSNFNGHLCKLTLALRLNTSGTPDTNTKLKIKNISIITTRQFSADFGNGDEIAVESPTESI
jgi:hypothetical protein